MSDRDVKLAKFTDSISSPTWSYGAGTEVLVAGDQFSVDAVPERIGTAWLDSGLLVAIDGSPTDLLSAPNASGPPGLSGSSNSRPPSKAGASRR